MLLLVPHKLLLLLLLVLGQEPLATSAAAA
jgi:hypothetical protein